MIKPLWLLILDVVIDSTFIFDIFLSFRTVATYHVRGEEVRISDPVVLVKMYGQSWFVIDALSCGIPPWGAITALIRRGEDNMLADEGAIASGDGIALGKGARARFDTHRCT